MSGGGGGFILWDAYFTHVDSSTMWTHWFHKCVLGLSAVLRQHPGHSDFLSWFLRRELIWGCRASLWTYYPFMYMTALFDFTNILCLLHVESWNKDSTSPKWQGSCWPCRSCVLPESWEIVEFWSRALSCDQQWSVDPPREVVDCGVLHYVHLFLFVSCIFFLFLHISVYFSLFQHMWAGKNSKGIAIRWYPFIWSIEVL